MSEYKPKKGDRVRLIHDLPPQVPADTIFKVVVVQDAKKNPGKAIGLEAPERWPHLHECDGAAADMRGWWTIPPSLEPTQL